MFLIHYTDRCNLEMIRECRVLKCARSLMTPDEVTKWARVPRPELVPLSCGAVLRDQQPLTSRIVLSDGAPFAEFVQYLNGHVFFWPDSSDGKRHRKTFRARYQHPCNVGLRCDLRSLRDANPGVEILFSPFNSGSTPRSPKKSPRSLNLFQPLETRGGQRLAEVVVWNEVRLPDNTQIECEDGNWRDFFCGDAA